MRGGRRGHSPLTIPDSLFITRARARGGFSLVEILIAMFIFMFGILGVLSMFPVAMSSAGRSIGRVRANIVAQSVLAQLQVDCRVAIETGTAVSVGVDADLADPDGHYLETNLADVDNKWNGYFITITSGARKGTTRLIWDTTAANNRLYVSPRWNPDPTAETPDFVITRMGLPSLPRGTLSEDAVDGGDVIRTNVTWNDNQWNGYYIEILDGPAAGEIRQINPTGGTVELNGELQLLPPPAVPPALNAWEAPRVPLSGNTFAITRDPLGGTRVGYIREFTGQDSFYAGTADAPGVDPLSWSAPWRVAPGSSDPEDTPIDAGNCGAGTDADHLEVADATDVLSGHIAVITGPADSAALGQVRLVTGKTGNVLDIFPSWLGTATDQYEVRRSLGHFLVITTGRSAGKILPITGYDPDPVGTGDKITCNGARFRELGVTAAESGGQYRLQNATGFMIVGSDTFLGSIIAQKGLPATKTDFPGDYGYALNTFGRPKAGEPQCGADIYFEGTTDRETSEYSSVCIFSEGDALTEGPVRADVFVFRNFNNAADLWENRKPVGHVTGYIGRP